MRFGLWAITPKEVRHDPRGPHPHTSGLDPKARSFSSPSASPKLRSPRISASRSSASTSLSVASAALHLRPRGCSRRRSTRRRSFGSIFRRPTILPGAARRRLSSDSPRLAEALDGPHGHTGRRSPIGLTARTLASGRLAGSGHRRRWYTGHRAGPNVR
jgi:hypothetical protein